MLDTVVLINSWDKNKKLWPVVKHAFNKYWPDCKYPIYLISNFETSPIGETIKVGKEMGWANNTIAALKTLECRNVIWMLEDYWFVGWVDNGMVEKYVSYVSCRASDYIRMVPSAIETKLPFKYDNSLHHYPLNSPHKTSLGASIWNKELLQRLMVPGESIWQFECEAVNRTTRKDVSLFTTDSSVFPLADLQMMVHGDLSDDAYLYLKNEGLKIVENKA